MIKKYKKVKFFYLTLLFCFSPVIQVNSTTPHFLNYTRTEYREEYIPGTRSNSGFVKSYDLDVVIPYEYQSNAKKIESNDFSQGSFIDSIPGVGIVLTSSSGKDRFWAVPAGETEAALIGCQMDGGC